MKFKEDKELIQFALLIIDIVEMLQQGQEITLQDN